MQDLMEPTAANIDTVVVNPGTHYFVVMPDNVANVRSNIYSAAKRTGQFIAHTNYNRVTYVLRVIINS